MSVVLVCAGITIYFQHKTITEQHKSVIKITDCNRVNPSNYKPINK